MEWYRNQSLSTKLMTSFLVLVVLTGISGYLGYSSLNNLSQMTRELEQTAVTPLVHAGAIDQLYQRNRVNVIQLITHKDPVKRAFFEQRFVTIRGEITAHADSLRELLKSKKALAAFDGFAAARKEYLVAANKAMSLGISGQTQEALEQYYGEMDKKMRVTMTAIQQLISIAREEAAIAVGDAEQEASSASMNIVIIAGISMLLAIVISIATARSIVNPVMVLLHQAEAIADGDLTVNPVQHTKDEIGQLEGAFGAMVNGLRSTIENVIASSSSVASASSQISSSTEQMAAGAQEQTSQAGEVASAVEEMAKTIMENSRNAVETSAIAKKAKDAAEDGEHVVAETVNGMKRIADVVKRSTDTVLELGRSSDQIGEIISVIDDIADQTNLLALNAAIEAARAGEQGRGFAVVADEVRKLAERTTKATKEIADMIRKIQNDTKGAVVSMSEGTKHVDEGILLAERAGSSLHVIMETSHRVTEMILQIASASEEQSSASEQISKNVEGISQVTQETASGTQQVARAAEDLNRLTEQLQQLVQRFKLDTGHHTAASPGHHASDWSVHETGRLLKNGKPQASASAQLHATAHHS